MKLTNVSDKEFESEQLFLVKSGDGYFIEFNDLMPHLTTNPLEANQYPEQTARNIVTRLNELGYTAVIVKARAEDDSHPVWPAAT